MPAHAGRIVQAIEMAYPYSITVMFSGAFA